MKSFILYLVIPRKINFLTLGRCDRKCEQRFRQKCSKDFDWLEFNLSLSNRLLNGDRNVIAVNPIYTSKSGKNTQWIDYLWSGATGQAKKGSESLGVCLIDVDNKDSIRLQTVQTSDHQNLETEQKIK